MLAGTDNHFSTTATALDLARHHAKRTETGMNDGPQNPGQPDPEEMAEQLRRMMQQLGLPANGDLTSFTVSYTHLTLPTILLV